MNRTLTETETKILKSIQSLNLSTVEDFKDLEFKLDFIDDGLYRNAYRILGTELVVKIPKRNEWSIAHSLAEIKTWKAILRWRPRIVPPLRYHNLAGVVITDFLQVQCDTDLKTRAALSDWRDKLNFPNHITSGDLHPSNIGVYHNRFVITDLGCFQTEGV